MCIVHSSKLTVVVVALLFSLTYIMWVIGGVPIFEYLLNKYIYIVLLMSRRGDGLVHAHSTFEIYMHTVSVVVSACVGMHAVKPRF